MEKMRTPLQKKEPHIITIEDTSIVVPYAVHLDLSMCGGFRAAYTTFEMKHIIFN